MRYTLVLGEKPLYFEITKQPENVYASSGSSVSITVEATGEGLTYQWWYLNPGETTWKESTTGATDTYTVTINSPRNGRQVYVVITDAHGDTLTSGIATMAYPSAAPAFTFVEQPKNFHGQVGKTASFSVSVSGENLSYQWQTYNGSAWVDISGATATTYSVEIVAGSDGAKYRCMISDGEDSVASTEAIIMIVEPVPYFEFGVARYKVGTMALYTAVDVVGSQLSIDEMEIVVNIAADEAFLLESVSYGTPAWIVDSANNIYAKIYFKSAERLGKTAYKLKLMSAVGFLDKIKHMGGVYAQTTAGNLIAELIGNKFTYSVDPVVSSAIVNGWLPIDSARNNLHRLMFALGISLRKDVNGDIVFMFLTDSAGTSVPQERIFTGARVKMDSPVTAVEVVEHSFNAYSGVAEATLFDNSDRDVASNLLIEFGAPYFGLRASGLTIVSSGVNYAVVSGQGVLYGKPYDHETRIVRKEVQNVAGEENIKRIGTDDGLINALNSENVATRTLAYYSQKKTTEMAIRALTEKPGDMISFTDAHGAAVKGLITKSNVRLSTFPKARLTVVEGYTPTGQGNFFSHRILVTESGTVTIPAGVTHIRLILGGGGSGGSGGYKGADGKIAKRYQKASYWYEYGYGVDGQQVAASGGAGGAPGTSGKIYVADIDVTNGEVMTFSLGSGGAGGTAQGGAGSAGTDSSVTSTSITASSADGEVTHGYTDPLTGDVFSADGAVGIPGGAGGLASVARNATVTLPVVITGQNGEVGGSSVGGSGGAGGNGADGTFSISHLGWAVDGGGGGGAAYGADGAPGADGYGQETPYEPEPGDDYEYPYITEIYAGRGGNGANAGAPAAVNYGCGGNGGNGGGGGGNGGGLAYMDRNVNPPHNPWQGGGYLGGNGVGGAGSAGGAGGGGYAIIYYN